MGDHLDVPLEDATQMEEVELVSTLMIAASAAERPLQQAQIDALLGLGTPRMPQQTQGGSEPTR